MPSRFVSLSQASSNYHQLLVEGLVHHSAEHREDFIQQLFAPPGAQTGAPVAVSPQLGAFLATIGASGELEGFELEGEGWRFGAIPL